MRLTPTLGRVTVVALALLYSRIVLACPSYATPAIALDHSNPEHLQPQASQRVQPKTADDFNQRAVARLECRDVEGAIADFTQAIRLAPDTGFLYMNRGQTYAQMGNFIAAIPDFTRDIQLTGAQNTPSVLYRGFSYLLLNDRTRSQQDFDQVIQQNPGNPNAYAGRGSVKLLREDYAGAIADFEQAQRLNYARLKQFVTHNPRTNFEQSLQNSPLNLSASLFQDLAQRYRQSPQQGRQAIQNPDSALNIALLGVAFINIENNKGAIAFLRKASELFSQQGDQAYAATLNRLRLPLDYVAATTPTTCP